MLRMRTLSVFVFSAGLVLAGCGGTSWKDAGGTPGGARGKPIGAAGRARLLAALDHTTALHTARIAMNEKLDGFSTVGTTSFTGDGVIDMTSGTTALTMHVSQGGADVALEMRVLNGVVYLNRGGVWKSMRVTANVASNTDPSSYLSYLRGVADDVGLAGPDTVRGVATTRYTASVDLNKAVARLKVGAQRTAVQSALSLLGHLTLPTQVWLDDAGRLRKLEMTIDLTTVAAKLGIDNAELKPKLVIAIELYDFGVAVKVKAPAGAMAVASPTEKGQDRATEIDLRDALTAEKTYYTDIQEYGAATAAMKQIEPSLDWGGKLKVVVGDAVMTGDKGVVCVSETSPSGTTFALGDVSAGSNVGTYYGKVACPSTPTPANVASLGSSW